MGSIFSNQQTSQSEREAFLQSFKQATWGEEENRLCKTLEDFVKKHQNRWLTAPQADRWGGEDLLWKDGCPYSNADIRKTAGALRDLLGPAVSPHKTYMNGWCKVCDILEDYVPGTPVKTNAQLKRAIPLWSEYAGGGLVEEKNKFEISPELGAVMTDLIGAYIKSEIEVRMKRTQGLYAVISAYEQSYHKQVRSRGRLCFSDLTLLLAGEGAMKIWDDESRNLIDYRLDARYDHWMLDEFQDTSQPQWKAVGNLVDEIMQDPEGQRLALSERVETQELHAFIEIGPDIMYPAGEDKEAYLKYYSQHSFNDQIRYWFQNVVNNNLRELRAAELNLYETQAENLLWLINVEGMGLVTVDKKT